MDVYCIFEYIYNVYTCICLIFIVETSILFYKEWEWESLMLDWTNLYNMITISDWTMESIINLLFISTYNFFNVILLEVYLESMFLLYAWLYSFTTNRGLCHLTSVTPPLYSYWSVCTKSFVYLCDRGFEFDSFQRMFYWILEQFWHW